MITAKNNKTDSAVITFYRRFASGSSPDATERRKVINPLPVVNNSILRARNRARELGVSVRGRAMREGAQ